MNTAIVWFRQDLRLSDHPALARALASHERVVPVYIHTPDELGRWRPGAAACWWLHHSLAALDRSLRERGSRLVLRAGPSLATLKALIDECGANAVYYNRLYEPGAIARDTEIKQALRAEGIAVESHNGALIHEPWEVTKPGKSPYLVYTPYWKACVKAGWPEPGPSAPESLPPVDPDLRSLALGDLGLLPRIHWYGGIEASWQVGEEAAQTRLAAFIDDALGAYADERNRPDRPGTSRLSPHLHHGEISPRQVAASILERTRADPATESGGEVYLREIVWREFAHQLLYHFPNTVDDALDSRFDRFPWRDDPGALAVWQRGETGIPLVDAGMRELWHTGWMHNRVRMVVASLLTKNLLVHWQSGARWFWDTLVDADLASNTLGWQWTAGCGADAAPFFRVFNPVRQAERFDPESDYIRRWVPELAGLSNDSIRQPWDASAAELDRAGIEFGRDYPRPIVDLKATRSRALNAFDEIKGGERS